MLHLIRAEDGHLLRNAASASRHLATKCCCGCPACPSFCAGCPTAFSLNVSGIGGPGDACCTDELDGAFTLAQGLIGSPCLWGTGGDTINPGTGCAGGWKLSCQSVDCHNNPGEPRWVVSLYGSITFVWAEAPCTPGSPTCPPTGPYTVTCNTCTGGTSASIVVS